MRPYYQDPDVTLYLGDCREVAPQLPRGSVDVMITDPPYGVAFRSNMAVQRAKFDVMSGDDNPHWVVHAIGLCLPVIRRSRHIYVFGPFDFDGLPIGATAELIWDKGQAGMGNLTVPWGPAHERIIFGAYVPSKFDREHGKASLAARLRRGSVLHVPCLNSSQISAHPTEKPVMLLRQLIESSSLIGETVFDPFAGSGSTLEAAVVEGRRAVGIELDERYAETIAERMRALRERVV